MNPRTKEEDTQYTKELKEFIIQEGSTEEQLRTREKERVIATDVEDYVLKTKAWFTLTSVYGALGITTKEHVKDRKNVRMKILRMVDKNLLEHHSSIEGKYRLIDETCEEIRWWEGEESEIPIILPFGLHRYVKIYPGNSILISGKKDSGKTAMMLRMIQDNLNNEKLLEYYKSHIHYPNVKLFNYFNCETPKPELRERVKLVAGDDLQDWIQKVTFWERTSDFAQVMQRHVINCIDYLDAKEDAFKMKTYMDHIHNKIYGGAGIAIVARQLVKKEYKGKIILSGYGGEYVKNKPRLVLQLTEDTLLVEAAKNPAKREDGSYENINGWAAKFDLIGGHEFRITKQLGPQVYDPMKGWT